MSVTRDEPIDERVTRIARRWFPVAIALLTVAAGMAFGPGFGVLVLAAGAFIAAISSLWGSVRSLFGEAPVTGEDAFAIGAPSAEEEQKRAVLRAIKDVEFERSVGKISDADYYLLIGRYRAEAKRLLQILDERAQPERDRVEKLVQEHLAHEGLATPEEKAPEKKKRKKRKKASPSPFTEDNPFTDVTECPSCGTTNDADAVFCKKCATALGAEA